MIGFSGVAAYVLIIAHTFCHQQVVNLHRVECYFGIEPFLQPLPFKTELIIYAGFRFDFGIDGAFGCQGFGNSRQ